MTSHRIGATSLAFKNNSQIIRLYGKHEEVKYRVDKGRATEAELRDSVGLLRLEVSHFNSDACRRLSHKYSLEGRYAHLLLHSSIARQELDRGLIALGLNNVTETVDARVDLLREIYGDSPHTRRLVAFLGFLDRYGEGFWHHGFGGYRRSAYFQCRRDVKKAGVWLKSDHQLPPLQLIKSDQKQLLKAIQPVSNTICSNPATPDFQRWHMNKGDDDGSVTMRRAML
jgi:hypothetical protein